MASDINDSRRVVVTGMGAVSPLGNDVASTWSAMMNGECGVEPITRFDTTDYSCSIAAPVRDFDPLEYMDRRDARRMSAFVQLAVAAAYQAVDDAGLDFAGEDMTRVGVEIGSAFGGTDVVEEQYGVVLQRGARKVSPFTVPAMLASMPACFVAIQHGILGPVSAPIAACATGVVAIGEAARRVTRGDADVVLAGGADSPITPVIISAFGRMQGLSRRNDTPKRAITPFDADRDGTVLGEGAGVLALESLEHAQARGALILAEVKGYGLTGDAYHISSPLEDGSGAARAMSGALQDAKIAPAAVDYVAAHGTGTPMNDVMETKAIKAALGVAAENVAISSIKSMTGHTVGAAGALAAIATIKAMHDGRIPPTIGLESPDPECDLDYVPNKPRRAEVKVAMVSGFGFGGQNACVVLEKWEDS
ncbi:MAG: beta-ketoacyl-[acyl-carrier-protein] synthase II [Anaerolineales bacterium]|nr:MAG: beta-ketoacyl-[acyl-carrier-protein] synthase II [Anaerolineales bacterium]